MSSGNGASVYHPRQPQQSPLWKLLDQHYSTFEREYEQKFRRVYGYRRAVVDDVVRGYLRCGDLREGFARVRCPDCCHEYLLSFSCRGRWFCPSCHAKKVVLFGELLRGSILAAVPHRQYVFTLPKILRAYFRYDHTLRSKLCHCANRSLSLFLKTVLCTNGGQIGTVTAIQTFGDYGRWHPHLHLLVADGLFMPNGSFHVMPNINLQRLQELFRAAVLKMLKDEGKIGDELIDMLLQWRHVSGFNVHNGVKIGRNDEKGKESLAQYILRNPFSVDKIRYVEATGTVVYSSGMSHGQNKKNFEVFAAGEFIAAITQHIPDKSFQLVRYYGGYSNRSRGDRKKGKAQPAAISEAAGAAQEVIAITEPRTRRIPSKTWRECIKKIWEVDPLTCPQCGGEMKIISFIDEPMLIRRILEHLNLWQERLPKGLPPPEEQKGIAEAIVCESFDDGWGHYDKTGNTFH